MKIRGKNQGNSRNGFIIALICSVAFAFLFPSPGAKGGRMHPDLLNNAGVALILFLQGLAMAQLIFGGEPGIDPSADHVLSPVSVVRLRAACQSLPARIARSK